MKKFEPTRVRGIVAARADASPSNIAEAVDQVNRTFAAFREQNDRRLADLERGREDVVTNEHVDRINAAVTELSTMVNAQRETIDALRLGGGSGDAPNAAVREHRDAFNSWVRRGTEPAAGMRALEINAALTTQSDPDGGYLVPEAVDGAMTRVLGTVSAMRQLARVVQVGGGGYAAVVNLGGTSSGWVGEEAARPATNSPTLSRIEIPNGEIYANPAATQTMIDDSMFDVEAWLAGEIATEFAEEEGAAFVSGNGTNKPKGFLAYNTVANASYEWGKLGFVVTGAAAAFAGTDPADAIFSLYYALKSGHRNSAAFLTSDAVAATIRTFKDGQGNYLWAPPTADMPASVIGKSLYTDDNMPALAANAFPLAFGDFSGYTITDRIGTRITRDPYTNKPYVQFYATKRVGGGVTNFEKIKLLKCST